MNLTGRVLRLMKLVACGLVGKLMLIALKLNGLWFDWNELVGAVG